MEGEEGGDGGRTTRRMTNVYLFTFLMDCPLFIGYELCSKIMMCAMVDDP